MAAQVLEGHDIICLGPFMIYASPSKNVPASDSSFAQLSVVEEGDLVEGMDQWGALEESFAADFLIDTSVPQKLKR